MNRTRLTDRLAFSNSDIDHTAWNIETGGERPE